MKSIEGEARKLTIVAGENDQFQHHPLSHEIIKRAHALGLAGATVTRGIEGFGASNHIHTAKVLSLSSDLPVIVTIIDTVQAIEDFLPTVKELVQEGIIYIEDCVVVQYSGRNY